MDERNPSVAQDPLAGLPGYSLRRAANAMMSALSARLAVIDLRVTDATLLLVLAGGERLTSSDIGRILDIQRANMVPILGRLEKSGLIARKPIDRKSSAIVPTAAGDEKAEEARAIITRFETELLERIPKEHRDHFQPAVDSLWR